jgi:hypothetical protein
MDFQNFGELGSHLWRVSHSVDNAIAVESESLGLQVRNEVRGRFGTYQDGWPALAESTQHERQRQGFSPNDPLLRSGELQGAVEHQVTRTGLFVGIQAGKALSDGADAATVMAAQEFPSASSHIPARPVFAGVAYHLERNVHAFGLGVAIALFANRRAR